MKRAQAQHAERQWILGTASRLTNSAEAVYWNNRYTPPPEVKRHGGHLRLFCAITLLIVGPSGFAYLDAAEQLPRLMTGCGAALCAVFGLYLLMTEDD